MLFNIDVSPVRMYANCEVQVPTIISKSTIKIQIAIESMQIAIETALVVIVGINEFDVIATSKNVNGRGNGWLVYPRKQKLITNI